MEHVTNKGSRVLVEKVWNFSLAQLSHILNAAFMTQESQDILS
jgi:hypothetical protein